MLTFFPSQTLLTCHVSHKPCIWPLPWSSVDSPHYRLSACTLTLGTMGTNTCAATLLPFALLVPQNHYAHLPAFLEHNISLRHVPYESFKCYVCYWVSSTSEKLSMLTCISLLAYSSKKSFRYPACCSSICRPPMPFMCMRSSTEHNDLRI